MKKLKNTKKVIKVQPKRIAFQRKANPNSYEKDFYRWTNSQAKILKKKEFSDLDIMNLVEEIESLGKSDKRSLRSHIINLLLHMLKLKYQSGKASTSWHDSTRNALIEIMLILDDSPSLKRQIPKMWEYCYEKAREKALIETKLNEKTFPKECPWTIDEIFKERK